MAVLESRTRGKTICPSEALPPASRRDRPKMNRVRAAAVRLREEGKIEILQRGKIAENAPFRGPIRLRLAPYGPPFPTKGVDFREHPERYRIGRGEQGVLSVEPYKSELLPLWRFKTPDLARKSAKALLREFAKFARKRDLVGMDMARKFLQMGYTRSRRYANHRTGKKYVGPVPPGRKGRSGAHGRKVAALAPDAEKAECAEIFRRALARAEGSRLRPPAGEMAGKGLSSGIRGDLTACRAE